MTFVHYSTGFVALAAGLASLGVAGWRLRRALLPAYTGAIGRLTEIVLGLSTLVVVLEAAGAVGWYRQGVVIVAVPAAGAALAVAAPRLGRRFGPGPASLPVSGGPSAPSRVDRSHRVMVVVALVLAFVVGAQWIAHSTTGLELGMGDLDSLRYHGPFAATWVQQHGIVHLAHTSAQNQEVYFPGNTELVDGYGILLFGRDVLTPLRNLPWLAIAFLAAWCCGRRFGNGPAALAGVAAVCSTPLLTSIEPGSAKNDIVGLALVLATAALVLHALPAEPGSGPGRRRAPPAGLAVAGAAAGLAAGTKLTTVGPVLVLCATAAIAAGPGRRWRAAGWLAAPALVTGGFWYGRNIAYTGTPFPWFRLPLGVITLVGPDMPYNDRFGYSVLHYARSRSFWEVTGVPGLQTSFGGTWPLLVLGAVAVATLAVLGRAGGRSAADRLIGVTALASMAAYLITPWGAGGPQGNPHLFDLDLRFLAPALGLAAAAAARPGVARCAVAASAVAVASNQVDGTGRWPGTVAAPVLVTAVLGAAVVVAWLALRNIGRAGIPRRLAAIGVLIAVVGASGAAGWPVQRDYLEDRYAPGQADNPAALAIFRDLRHQRIAVGGFADGYPLYGETLTNHVQYVGVKGPGGLFRRVAGCREWLSRLRSGRYDYVVVSVSPAAADRTEPPEAAWTARDKATREVFHRGLTTVFRLVGRPDPASCARPTAR